MKNYEKVYVLDTNIILNNAQNILTLADSGNNLIILPETVTDEIDSKKSGLDEINYQARQYSKLLIDAEIGNSYELEGIHVVEIRIPGCDILMLSKDTYKADSDNLSKSIRNDRKILEITKDFQNNSEYKDLLFLSLDVMARHRAVLMSIPTEALTLGKKDIDSDIDFHYQIDISEFNGDVSEIDSLNIDSHYSSLEITNEKGKTFYYTKMHNIWKELPKNNVKRLPVPPINLKQKVMTELITRGSDVTVVAGPAGTGKTLIATGCAMKLIDSDERYKKIYYIRRTVISGTKEDELGFLPGTLEEKMQGYNQPMEDSLKKIAQLRKRNAEKEEIEEIILKFKERYDIEYLYAGHLRGSTLDEGSILICDEVQNFDIASIRTIFSRMDKDSIIVAMGSNNQIDSSYLTKNTNALTFLMNKCGVDNESGVSVNGVRLTNVMRSKLAEWADDALW